ncbi:MAG: PH domain-containing protein [Kineosporiaceae bacterium]
MPVVLRPPAWQRVLNPLAALVPGSMGVTWCAITGGWWWAAAVPLAAAVVVLAWRFWTSRVEVHADELALVNWFRTLRLPWDQVARVDTTSDGVCVLLRDGRFFSVSAFQHGHEALGFARAPARQAARRLDDIRRERQRRRRRG